MSDGAFLARDGIERYRLTGAQVRRESPIATSPTGFIHEWLTLDDMEAKNWSTPQAAAVHSAAAKTFGGGFDWDHVAQCSGSTWEIGIRPNESKAPVVFRVSGSTASELKIAVTDRYSKACEEPEFGALESAARSLPLGR